MTASFDLLRLGLSGLLAAQRQLTTAGHNVANASREGYARQRVEVSTNAPRSIGGRFAGTGVHVTDVRRVVDQLLDTELQRGAADHSQATAFLGLAERIDTLLSDPDTGLGAAVGAFFGTVQASADDPASLPQRQVLLREAQALTGRLNRVDSALDALGAEVNERLRLTVDEVNGLAGEIARLNGEIAGYSSHRGQPNDLLDQRSGLLQQLSDTLGVRTVTQDDGAVNVFTGFGAALVLGTQHRPLAVAPSPLDPQRLEIATVDGTAISASLEGGEIGALLTFRAQMLDPARGGLGRIATGLAASVNAQHRLGVDLNGNPGGDVFTLPAPLVRAAQGNAGGAASARLADVAGLTTSDYVLRADDGANRYTLTRLSDGASFAIDTAGTSPFTTVPIDGFTLTIDAGAAAGDRFLVRPVSRAGAGIDVALSDPVRIAAAAPVVAGTEPANTGSGRIASVQVDGTASLPLVDPPVSGSLALEFDAANAQFTLVPDPYGEGPLPYDPAADADGKTFSLLNGELAVTVVGRPDDGDGLRLADNIAGIGDNRNLLRLAELETRRILEGGGLDVGGAQAQLVSGVGAAAHSAQTTARASAGVLDQVQAAWQSVSGVNLDEEAANLLRFQQAYQAAAQVIAAADDLFQTLLAAVRR
jgi:flagellar hook-associated protein 1 FlgK